jgi:hypothetical protein
MSAKRKRKRRSQVAVTVAVMPKAQAAVQGKPVQMAWPQVINPPKVEIPQKAASQARKRKAAATTVTATVTIPATVVATADQSVAAMPMPRPNHKCQGNLGHLVNRKSRENPVNQESQGSPAKKVMPQLASAVKAVAHAGAAVVGRTAVADVAEAVDVAETHRVVVPHRVEVGSKCSKTEMGHDFQSYGPFLFCLINYFKNQLVALQLNGDGFGADDFKRVGAENVFWKVNFIANLIHLMMFFKALVT